jgi:exodeoxyribonuclease VII large subunit
MQDERKIYSLLEVTRSIQKTLMQRYTSVFWVKAEMNKLNYYPHSGHCYPDLVEKQDGKVVAQLRANLWKTDYERVNAAFVHLLHEPLKDGIHIMFTARIQFDPVYGISLRIVDIDPVYSLGELEREKQECIAQLKKEGLYDLNREQELALLPQRIAIISVETSKGYADFTKVIDQNPWGYRFFHMLFPALLQGDKAAESVTAQLNSIRKVASHFDLVAIIRGGGGDVGLSCYNDLTLNRCIAQFPIPVMTGIGHSTNETVAELIAYKNAITPTELADFLIQHFHNFSVPLKNAIDSLKYYPAKLLKDERLLFENTVTGYQRVSRHFVSMRQHLLLNTALQLKSQTSQRISDERNRQTLLKQALAGVCRQRVQEASAQLPQLLQRLRLSGSQFLYNALKKIEYHEKSVELLSPANVLKRGYSLSLLNGKVIRSVLEVQPDDRIETRVSDGIIISTVKQTHYEQ